MTLAVLGPLHLTHKHLWSLTWGEVDDLLHAWRYNEYLEMTKLATFEYALVSRFLIPLVRRKR